MAIVLPKIERKPGIGEQLGSGLGQGLSQGAQLASQAYLEKQKMKQRQNLIQGIEADDHRLSQNDFMSQIKQSIPQIEQKLGFKLTPEQVESIGDQLQRGQNHQEPDEFMKAKQYAAAGEHDLAKISSDEAKLREKRKLTRAAGHEEIAKQTLKSSAEQSELIPQKEFALQNMIDALETGDLSFFSPDSLADATGIEAFRTPEGAGFKTAGKEFFLGSLKRAGTRPNQWIEQQISDMLPKIGRSPEANLSVTEALKMEMDIQKKQIELTNSIADEMERDFGYIKRDLADQVRKRISPYANEKQKELQRSLMDIKDKYQPSNKSGYLMYDPYGNLRRVPKKSVPDAKKEGYRLYK